MQKKNDAPIQVSAFPVGDKLPEMFSKYFIGQAYLAPLTHHAELNVPISNVTFEPGCRNNWHSHTGGQILVVVGGHGWYQEKGKPAQPLKAGDVVEILPDVEHWHGAASDSWFSHLAIECNPQTNKNTWLAPVTDAEYSLLPAAATTNLTPEAKQNYDKWWAENPNMLYQTDPDIMSAFYNFAYDDVMKNSQLNDKTRAQVVLAACIAVGAQSEYRDMLTAALQLGVTPIEIKEVLYQAIPYVGMARTLDFIPITNDFLIANGIALPLESQATTTRDNRMEKGLEVQKSLFGTAIDNLYKNAPQGQLHIQEFLSGNCFGDYVARGGLDVKTRELLTFSMLISLGGCEPQVKAHIHGNIAAGNDKAVLLSTVTQLIPFIGYPRSLNALACINEVLPQK